jgi:NTE family protein
MERRRVLLAGFASGLLTGCGSLPFGASPAATQPPPSPPAALPAPRKPRIGLALGGGAARGFAHVGVIKTLENQGIQPDLVVGTSAGAVVGALYANGISAFDLQKLAIQMDESQLTDWTLLERGWLKGEALERFINQQVANKPLEALPRRFACTATDIRSGELVLFQRGNTGLAVRASAAVPGVFSPVTLNGRDYVDGGLVAPVPAREARMMGADLVIAVDISARPSGRKGVSGIELLLDTISTMGGAIAREQLKEADVVIRPAIQSLAATHFQQRHEAILEGERAAQAALPAIRERLAKLERA